MKNLFLATALVLALSANAANEKTVIGTTITVEQQKEYKKIETSQVPADVLKQVSAKYSGFALTEAYVAEDGEYKLILSKDGKTVKAYYKSTGQFVKEEA